MSAGLASQHFFGREVVSSFGTRLHLLRENPFDMLAGGRDRFTTSSPPPPRATGRSILQIGSRLRAFLAIRSWRTSIIFASWISPLF